MMSEEEEKVRMKRSCILRIGIGLYLVYLAYGLGKDIMAGIVTHLPIMIGAAVLFAVVGAVCIVKSSLYLYRNKD